MFRICFHRDTGDLRFAELRQNDQTVSGMAKQSGQHPGKRSLAPTGYLKGAPGGAGMPNFKAARGRRPRHVAGGLVGFAITKQGKRSVVAALTAYRQVIYLNP